MPSVSMRVLAERLGLSPGTVSKALAGRPGPSAVTVDRVRALAEQLDFRPDPLLARQGTARRIRRELRLIAVISARPTHARRRSERLFAHLGEAALARGYHLQLCALDHAIALGACGLLIDGHETVSASELGGIDLPMVQIGGRHSLPCPRVAVDPFTSVLRCVEAVRAAGYGRIGCAPCRLPCANDDDRMRQAAALLAGPELPPFLGAIEDGTALRRWFDRHRPAAVIAFASLQRRWLPADTPFASLHVQANNCAVTGILTASDESARCALEQLDLTVRAPRGLMERALILLPPTWNAGRTLPPACPSPPRADA